MMRMKAMLGATAIAFALAGCKGSQTVAAGTSGGATGAGSSTDSGGTEVQYITDPSLNNMNAIEVTLPAGWKFQSVFLQGGTCAPTPYGVFRATGPDGQSMVEREPTLAWEWGQGPMIGYIPKTDCLPLQKPMSAQDFLQYMAATLKVHYEGAAQVPAAEEAAAEKDLSDAEATYAPKYAAMHMQPPRETRQLARAVVSFQKGSVSMQGQLDALVDCTETSYAGTQTLSNASLGHPAQIVAGQPSTVDKCLASVTYTTAPAGQLAGLVQTWDGSGMGTKPVMAWEQAWIARSNQQTTQMIGQMNAAAAAERQATAQQFAHSMAVEQQMHNQFMATLQAGTDASMARSAASMQAQSTSASDWVDYALDRQTVLNTNTGQVSKISNQVTVGGALEQVHGNGTPIQ
jgi:hypothetical protein